MLKRSEVPDCGECDVMSDVDPGFEAAEQGFIERVCEACPWGQDVWNPRLNRLLFYLALTDSPCDVGRHELTNDDWIALGRLRTERERLAMEREKK